MRVGIDIMEVNRFTLDEKFISKVASEKEILYINKNDCEKGKLQRLGALWCVKEAVFKCIGLGRESGITMKDVELCHEENGKPYVILKGRVKEQFLSLGLKELEISLSHSDLFVTAVCIAN